MPDYCQCCISIFTPSGVHTCRLDTPSAVQPCGGAIPLCMIDEFDLPADIIDRKVTKMKMISPSNREVDVGKTLSETEYIGMCRREVMDDFLRQRAKKSGAKVINSLFMKFERPQGEDGPYKLHFNNYDAGGKVGKPDSIEVSAGNSQPLQMTALFLGNHPGCLPDCHCVAEEHCSCYIPQVRVQCFQSHTLHVSGLHLAIR